ncbi:MAG: DUF4258 domain-containing protein [Melioribacteraceae bacterium]|nr:DUF4258 domain-containing protein [Melioribacteraceae bacterium]
MSLEIEVKIHNLALEEKVIFTKHALTRSIERSISLKEIIFVLTNCCVIEIYDSDKPLVSYLVSGVTQLKDTIHVVIAFPPEDDYLLIITLYEPSNLKWDMTFTKRIK